MISLLTIAYMEERSYFIYTDCSPIKLLVCLYANIAILQSILAKFIWSDHWVSIEFYGDGHIPQKFADADINMAKIKRYILKLNCEYGSRNVQSFLWTLEKHLDLCNYTICTPLYQQTILWALLRLQFNVQRLKVNCKKSSYHPLEVCWG